MKVFASPSRYIQGKDALFQSIEHIKSLGQTPLILCDDVVYNIVGERFLSYLQDDLLPHRVSFNGEASDNEINRVVAVAKEKNSDLIIGLGGGKTIDSAKAIADKVNLPVVIAQAPKRLLASGIADGLATWVEARAVLQKNGIAMAGGRQTLAGVAIAQACERTLFNDSLQALAACDAKVVTKALENVIEANTLLSGLGFESAGLAAAHAIHNGFTALSGDIHHLTHGEKVAYGTLTQLFLENRPKEEIDRYINLYQAIGMPTTLAELHLGDATYEELLKVGQQATIEGETIHEMPFKISAEDVAAALLTVDRYVSNHQ
ncbi:glycerol dehydrogenase [Streptococcus agalactiae]|nr:glycerol dehydrogenase [Streptococcus agalactiae]